MYQSVSARRPVPVSVAGSGLTTWKPSVPGPSGGSSSHGVRRAEQRIRWLSSGEICYSHGVEPQSESVEFASASAEVQFGRSTADVGRRDGCHRFVSAPVPSRRHRHGRRRSEDLRLRMRQPRREVLLRGPTDLRAGPRLHGAARSEPAGRHRGWRQDHRPARAHQPEPARVGIGRSHRPRDRLHRSRRSTGSPASSRLTPFPGSQAINTRSAGRSGLLEISPRAEKGGCS